ncbi:ABC transporter [Halobacterium jilantaiense]|uniref:ABC-2 type transport system permease protein n=1 Tax=Halobacterium jilantaiense TaxID=355548 RepID=A0A1I0N8L4_9EURY|nr:ABC transporter [Halobacterium jilantaiense]SEV96794.1 ABC-2 type transport system permease protein [Halobacterium jilantaiense]
MNRHLVLFRVIAGKSVALSRRYFVNTLMGFVTLYVFFALVFFGGQFVAADLISRSVGPLVVGYFLFTMAVSAYADLTHDLTDEAQWGTLEQLSMSPFGFTEVVAVKTAVNLLGTFATGIALLVLMMLTTGTRLSVAPLSLVVLGLLTLLPVVGLGFAFGGMALVYKQIEKVFPLVQLSFAGLIALPVEEHALLKLLPMSLGSHTVQRVLTDGLRLWELPAFDLVLLVGQSGVYLAIGLLVFRAGTAKARERGVLGHY